VLSVSSLLGTVVLGAWLDVWDRRRTLVLCNLALALLTALLPLAAHAGVTLVPIRLSGLASAPPQARV